MPSLCNATHRLDLCSFLSGASAMYVFLHDQFVSVRQACIHFAMASSDRVGVSRRRGVSDVKLVLVPCDGIGAHCWRFARIVWLDHSHASAESIVTSRLACAAATTSHVVA